MISGTFQRTSTAGFVLAALLIVLPPTAVAQHGKLSALQHDTAPKLHKTYLGFDTNLYPGDAMLPALHRHFAYLGYWLNNPPGMTTDEWAGKRAAVLKAGFGFLILFNGRLYRQLRQGDPAYMGASDGASAALAAKAEGFPPHAIIFLDIEEGGRMLPEQLAYIGAWMRVVRSASYRTGVYCAAIPFHDSGRTLSTADDIVAHFPGTAIWAANDQCPPAPGCVAHPLSPSHSGFQNALVWQFSQSPRRRALTRACAETYASDGNCYAPGLPQTERTALDLDTSTSPDPSAGR